MSEKIVVCGASGYVGRNLIKFLLARGFSDIHALSSRPPVDVFPEVKYERCDLLDAETCRRVACWEPDWVYNLAAKVGGLGYIGTHKVDCMLSSLINTNLLRAIDGSDILGYFFASSSCVYPNSDAPLQESDACLGSALAGYGEEKWFSERLALAFAEERKVPVCIARLNTVYGPGDIRPEGCDHVTTSICKKVIEAKLSGRHEINIWGDGEQTRSFLYIDDCVEGIYRLMSAGIRGPTNLTHRESVSINQLVSMLEEIAAVRLKRFYSIAAPVGRKHKVCDNAKLRAELNWEPTVNLRAGLEILYRDLWDRAILKK